VAGWWLKGYDVSFLITNFHTEQMYKHKLVDFVIQVCDSCPAACLPPVSWGGHEQKILLALPPPSRLFFRSPLGFMRRRSCCHEMLFAVAGFLQVFELHSRAPVERSLIQSRCLHALVCFCRLPDQFMEDIDKEISEMKLMVNARARISANSFLSQVYEGLRFQHACCLPTTLLTAADLYPLTTTCSLLERISAAAWTC